MFNQIPIYGKPEEEKPPHNRARENVESKKAYSRTEIHQEDQIVATQDQPNVDLNFDYSVDVQSNGSVLKVVFIT